MDIALIPQELLCELRLKEVVYPFMSPTTLNAYPQVTGFNNRPYVAIDSYLFLAEKRKKAL